MEHLCKTFRYTPLLTSKPPPPPPPPPRSQALFALSDTEVNLQNIESLISQND